MFYGWKIGEVTVNWLAGLVGGLDDEQENGGFFEWIAPDVRQGGLKDEEITFFNDVGLAIDQVFYFAFLAADKFLPGMGDMAFAACGMRLKGDAERFDILIGEMFSDAFDGEAATLDDGAFVGFYKQDVSAVFVIEKIADFDVQGAGQALQGGNAWGNFVPLD